MLKLKYKKHNLKRVQDKIRLEDWWDDPNLWYVSMHIGTLPYKGWKYTKMYKGLPDKVPVVYLTRFSGYAPFESITFEEALALNIRIKE